MVRSREEKVCSVMLCNLYCGLVVLFIVLLVGNGDDERRQVHFLTLHYIGGYKYNAGF